MWYFTYSIPNYHFHRKARVMVAFYSTKEAAEEGFVALSRNVSPKYTMLTIPREGSDGLQFEVVD